MPISYIRKFCIILFFISSTNASALSVEDRLADNEEKRANEIFTKVKCAICQGQTIDSSDSKFSSDLRGLIRNFIKEGKTDAQIEDELTKRFGDSILISSKPEGFSLIIWILPGVVAITAGIYLLIRRKK